jgi:hypothetical protein
MPVRGITHMGNAPEPCRCHHRSYLHPALLPLQPRHGTRGEEPFGGSQSGSRKS